MTILHGFVSFNTRDNLLVFALKQSTEIMQIADL